MYRRVLRYPETDVLVARWILRVRLEGRNLPLLELVKEAGITRPEQPNIRDGEENHRDSFKANPECPCDAVRYI